MARKIKFPLEMLNGAQIRTIEELREFFDLEKVLGYFLDGKLLIWLNDRYYENEAAQVRELDSKLPDFKSRLCKILGVESNFADSVELEMVERRNAKIAKLKQVTDDEELIKKVDSVAFNQEDLSDLLDDEKSPIYLCGGSFTIPLSKENTSYIGIQSPTAVIKSAVPVDFVGKGITFQNIEFDKDYQQIEFARIAPTARAGLAPNVQDSCMLKNVGSYKVCEGKTLKGELAWKHVIPDGKITSPPLIHDDAVFFGQYPRYGNYQFMVLDIQTGKPKWSAAMDCEIKLSACIAEGLVIVASGLKLYAFDADSGKERWMVDVGKANESGTNIETITICGNTIFVGKIILSHDVIQFIIFDLVTGEKKLKKDIPIPGEMRGCKQISLFAAFINEMTVCLISTMQTSDRGYYSILTAINCMIGETKWQVSNGPGTIIATPIVYNDIIILTNYWGISAHDAQTGEYLWEWNSKEEHPYGSVVIKDDVIFFVTTKGLHARYHTGKSIWNFCIKTPHSHQMNWSWKDAFLPITTVSIIEDTAVFGLDNEFFYGVDINTGKEMWKCALNEMGDSTIDDGYRRPDYDPIWTPVYGAGRICFGAGNTLFAIK